MNSKIDKKIVIPGGAGLVGQNLVVRLKAAGYTDLVVLDKHRKNLDILQQAHSEITAQCVDLALPGEWQRHFENADCVVMLQAQIGGLDNEEFERNNLDSTGLILDTIKANDVPYVVHISSSVVESVANDFYTNSKKQQEQLVKDSGIACMILRPTLMFGWFDRKHLGWLSRFMQKVPVFPIPGHGKYMRQPLYVGDFCNVIISCINHRMTGSINISGHEKIDYIDIIRQIKQKVGSRAVIIKIPYGLFHALLTLWALFDSDPPFTTQQLAALIAGDEFEVVDWPGKFGVEPTPFEKAVDETFNDPVYSRITLDF